MTLYFGTHGTTKCRADNIVNKGFTISPKGYRGSGVYFWGYTSKSLKQHCHELAVGWWAFAKKKGDYTKDSNTSCRVIYASIETENLLDLELISIREKLVEYCSNIDDRNLRGLSKKETLTKSYDMFVDDVEKKLKHSFDLVHVKVQKPNGCKTTLDQDVTGQPSCFVVKEPSCIVINDIEEM